MTEQQPPMVSVIVPVYNAGPYVEGAARSALDLAVDAEVILVEDGSTDASLEVCARLARESDRVSLLRHPGGANRGAGASRNLGIRRARGRYVAFLDADDWYLPNRFDVDVPMMEADPSIDGVYGAASVRVEQQHAPMPYGEDELTTLRRPIPPEELFATLLLGDLGRFCTLGITVRRSMFDQVGPFDEGLRLAQDSAMWLRMAAVGKLVAGSIARPIAMRRRHATNRSRVDNPEWQGAGCAYVWSVLKWAHARGLAPARQAQLARGLALAIVGRREGPGPLGQAARIGRRTIRYGVAYPAVLPELAWVLLKRLTGRPQSDYVPRRRRPPARPACPQARTDPLRLLIVSHQFSPSCDTSGRRPSRLAEYLTQRGAPPVVVTGAAGFHSYGRDPGPCIRDELRVHEVPYRPWYGKQERVGPLRRQMANVALTAAYRRAIERALRDGPLPDAMLFRGVPFWYFPLARYFRMRWGIPYVLDLGDVWYMKGLRYRRGQRSGLRNLQDRACEAWSVDAASLVVLTTEEQTDVYRSRYRRRPARDFMTVRWGYDAERLAAAPPADKPAGLFRIAIVGRFSVYDSRDAEGLAQAVGNVSVTRDVEVVHMGLPEPRLRSAFDAAGVGHRLRTMGMVPYAECLAVIKSADCGVASPLSNVSVPVKVYDYMGANRPVLAFAPVCSAMASILAPFPGAFVVQSGGQAADALRQVASGKVTELQPGFDPTPFSQQHQFGLLVERIGAVVRERGRGGSTCAC